MKTIPLLILPLFPLTVHAADPVVKLAGIQLVADDGAKDFDGFKTYNNEKGLGITLIVRAGDKQIVGFDDDKAALKIGGAAAKCRYFGGDMAFSKDHHALRLEFATEGNPQLAADGTVKVTGEIPVTLATGKEETKSAPFTIAAGTAIQFAAGKTGLPTLKVKSSGKPKWGDSPFEVVLSTDRNEQEFAGIRFFTKDGTLVESKHGGSSWMSSGSQGSGEITYTFKAAQTDLILAVETWTGREDKKLKIDLAAGLAIPK